MDNKERGKLLVSNLKKVLNNLEKRVKIFVQAKDENNIEQIEILRESIVQNHEMAIELSWKCARSLSLWIEPEGKISGSTTAIKHALKTGVIEEDDIARGLLSAIQDRNKSSHEYLLEKNIDEYVENIINKHFDVFKEVLINFENCLKDDE